MIQQREYSGREVKFNKFVEDREGLLNLLSNQKESKIDIDDPLTLAYIGDAWFSLFIRQKIARFGFQKVRVLQNLESKIVSATGQSKAWHLLKDEWSDEENIWFKRGRNASPTRARAGGDYRTATGFETVLGFLFETNQIARLEEVGQKSLEAVVSELVEKNNN